MGISLIKERDEWSEGGGKYEEWIKGNEGWRWGDEVRKMKRENKANVM